MMKRLALFLIAGCWPPVAQTRPRQYNSWMSPRRYEVEIEEK